MSISQTEIARKVGVSRTAVSHVLNGRPHMVGQEVRERILDVIETSGYHRNALVRALKANRTHVAGIIVPEGGVSFYSEILQAAESAAAAAGYQIFLCQTHSLPEAMEKQIRVLREYRVDGLLIAPASMTANAEIYRLMLEQRFPYVLLDGPLSHVRVPYVANENVTAGRMATEHLIGLGHRRIACEHGYPESWSAQGRLTGYREALQKAGLTVDEALIVGHGFSFECGSRGVLELLGARADFTAVVASTDFAALGAIQTLTRAGLCVPDDVSVVGCGNLDISRVTTPALTTIDQKASEIGRRAMTLLLDMINGKTGIAREILIEPELVVRETTCRLNPTR